MDRREARDVLSPAPSGEERPAWLRALFTPPWLYLVVTVLSLLGLDNEVTLEALRENAASDANAAAAAPKPQSTAPVTTVPATPAPAAPVAVPTVPAPTPRPFWP